MQSERVGAGSISRNSFVCDRQATGFSEKSLSRTVTDCHSSSHCALPIYLSISSFILEFQNNAYCRDSP